MKKLLEIETPGVPNYLRLVGQKFQKELVDITSFTDEELCEIGKDWTEKLIKNAQKRRKEQESFKLE